MKRKVMTLKEVREYFKENPDDYTIDENIDEMGICALVDVENMGFCKDGVTRWYMFTLENQPCIYFKH